MILVDTSVWIEFLRGTGDPAAGQLIRMIDSDQPIAITEPVAMEILAGATSPRLARDLGALVDGLPMLEVDAHLDYRAAAQLFVASRQNGHPIRSIMDCLIAAVAVRRAIPLLHRDRDFDFLAEVCPLVSA